MKHPLSSAKDHAASPPGRHRNLFPYLINLPMVIYLCTILLFSLAWGIYLSFTDKVIGADPTWTGLENYIYLLKSPGYLSPVAVTVRFTLCAIVGKLLLGTVMALVLNVSFRGKNMVRALLLLPWTIPMIVVALNWRWIFAGAGGAANYILKSVGIIDTSLNWLGVPTLAFFCIVISDVWRGTPFFGMSILSRLQAIPKVYYEAATMDGPMSSNGSSISPSIPSPTRCSAPTAATAP